MDIQYLGGVLLLAIQDIQRNRDGFTKVDACYERHARAHRFFPKLASFIVTVRVVLVAVGLQ